MCPLCFAQCPSAAEALNAIPRVLVATGAGAIELVVQPRPGHNGIPPCGTTDATDPVAWEHSTGMYWV